MKPFIGHLLDDQRLGGVLLALQAQMKSRLAENYDFQLLTSDQLTAQMQCRRPDLLVMHEPIAWKRLPQFWLLRQKMPLIYEEHHYSGGFEQHNVPSRRRFRLLMQLGTRLCNQVITISQGQNRWLRECGIPGQKLRLIRQAHGIDDLLQLAPPKFELPLTLGAYGRFSSQKGFDILLHALRRLPVGQFRLRLGGYGVQEDELRALAKPLPQVEFVGTVRFVPEFLASVAVVVIPSRWEPWGNVCLEARAAGRPVIVSDVDGLPEQADSCGLCVPGDDPDALAEAIARLPQEPLADWSVAARQSTMGVWERRLSELDRLYREVLA